MRRLAVAPLLLLALSGCISASGSDAPSTVVAPTPDPAARRGGVLRVGIVRPATLDPALVAANDPAAAVVVRTMCDSLLSVDPTTRELRPGIAKSWRVLAEGASVFLRIRGDARFSDGSKVSPRDVVASLQRMVDPNVVAPQAELFREVVGYADVRDGRIEPKSMPGIQVVSGDSVRIDLARADSQFVHALTLPIFAPVPRSRSGGAGFSQRPVCAGPYTLAQPYRGTETLIRLRRNDSYPGYQPALTSRGGSWADTVEFRIYRDRAAAAQGLRRGEVDVARVPNDTRAALAAAGFDPLSVTTATLEYIGVPYRPPFDDPNIRALLSATLDRQQIVNTVWRGARTPARAFLPPTLPDAVRSADVRTCRTSLGEPLTPTQLSSGEPARLRTRLRTALGTRPLVFYYNDEFANEQFAQAVARVWGAALGIRVVPRAIPFDEMLQRGASATGFDGVFRMAATAVYPSAAAFLEPLISRQSSGTTNLTFFQSEPLERQLERRARKAVDVEEQRFEYERLELALCGLLPVIPVAWGNAVYATSDRVVVAAHGGVDRSAGLVELRELALR